MSWIFWEAVAEMELGIQLALVKGKGRSSTGQREGSIYATPLATLPQPCGMFPTHPIHSQRNTLKNPLGGDYEPLSACCAERDTRQSGKKLS